jgi:hypothetical protein
VKNDIVIMDLGLAALTCLTKNQKYVHGLEELLLLVGKKNVKLLQSKELSTTTQLFRELF